MLISIIMPIVFVHFVALYHIWVRLENVPLLSSLLYLNRESPIKNISCTFRKILFWNSNNSQKLFVKELMNEANNMIHINIILLKMS